MLDVYCINTTLRVLGFRGSWEYAK